MGGNMSLMSRETASIATSIAAVAIGYACSDTDNTNVTSLMSFAYVGATSMWFGIQTWVSFFAGLTKIKILPRHWFSKVQRVLFQKYYLGGLMLNSTMLGAFLSKHPINTWQGDTLYKGASVMTSLSIVSICLLTKPKLDDLLEKMNEYEASKGEKEVVGPIKNPELLNDPEYKSLKKQFISGHLVAMVMNFIIYPITIYHVYKISTAIQF